MVFTKRQDMLEVIQRIGQKTCGYYDPTKSWPANTCDCKYGANGGPTGEKTGCPELRIIYAILKALSDEEWVELVHKAGGSLLISKDSLS